MGKEIYHGKESREKLLKGVNELANAVKVTLGPRGRNVIIEREGAPHITKDGVTVAKSIEFSDSTMNLGAQIIKEASQQTADNAGDGTTTSTVLAQHIFNEGMKQVEKGSNPIELYRGMQIGVKEVVKNLIEVVSKDIKSNDAVKNIATISANGDEEIGGIISEAIHQVGNDGVVTVEEGNSNETSLEIVEGLEFDKGYLSHFFMNNQSKLACMLDEPNILLFDGRISQMDDILGILESSSMNNKPIVIIAHDVDGEALASMVVNAARGTLKCLAVKAPGFGAERKEILKDIAALTGATVVGDELGVTLEEVSEEHFGTCDKVVSDKLKTAIIGGHGTEESINSRIGLIKTEKLKVESDFEKEKLENRLAKLSGGVAVIKVGAESEVELKEKKDRVDDAILSTKAALEEGIVPGGGVALIHSKNQTDRPSGLSTDRGIGVDIVYSACESPFRAIIENAGISADSLIEKLNSPLANNSNVGYDVRTEEFGDLIEAGVVDPTKVTRTAIEKAVSVAGTLLTTECMVVMEPETDENLKKLVYQYKYLKMDLHELKEQHSELTISFEKEFSNIIKRDGNIEKDVPIEEVKNKTIQADESVKDIYKKAAKQLHPDKGGDEEEFKELNQRYKSNDLLGVIDLAVDNKIEFDYKESDVELMNNSINSLQSEIEDFKSKLCYVWEYGTPHQRKQVLSTLGNHLGKPITLDELNEEQKKKLGLNLENQ